MQKNIFIILIVLFCQTGLRAQKFSSSIDLQLSVPQGDYKELSSDAGFGLRANLLYKPNYTSPARIGLELGIQEKGQATQYFSGNVYGYPDDFKESATNNIFSLMFVSRFQSPKKHRVRPFVDITAGWNVFFSTVSVDQLTFYSGYDVSYSKSTKAHWAFAYGLAGGVDISLGRRDDVGLELKTAYLAGSYTTYLSNPYIDSNGDVSFQQNSSRTTMLIPQVGVRIAIR